MLRREFSLAVGAETLACDFIGMANTTNTTDTTSTVRTIVLHGAGQSDRQRQWPLRESLAARDMSSIACDFSGHGQSSAHTPNSLEKRLAEAQALLDHTSGGPRTVIGVSMGGEIALRLACRAQNQIEHVVTLVGAIYDGAAFSLPFGPAFSAALRRPESWRDAEVLTQIANYTGHLTLVRAMQDSIIPPQAAELVRAHAVRSRSCRIIDLPGVDHRLSERCAQDETLRERLSHLIAVPALSN